VQVVSSVARQSMGIITRQKFEDRVHEEQDKTWNEDEGCHFANNQMLWLIQKVRFIPAYSNAFITSANY
jgi:hypothetical protein